VIGNDLGRAQVCKSQKLIIFVFGIHALHSFCSGRGMRLSKNFRRCVLCSLVRALISLGGQEAAVASTGTFAHVSARFSPFQPVSAFLMK
jgi:hypothetical protein